eukprot:TRINITY_DN4372_c0_g1_i9.p1 TRINITY_DN4372_c0_g1~~TRINITY_DN4372_c0_g1_i9.p1  ORF type:complete len:402 (+),score=104.14 TRINITY_DN4372_c0_g1_i9:1466-2671(+)
MLRHFAKKAIFSRRFSTAAPIFNFSEEENALRDAVRKFGDDVIRPVSKQMDRDSKMEPAVLKGLFDLGLMGIEIPEAHGGAGMSFTSSIIAIEELSRADPGVAVCMDVQNTLVNNFFLRFAGEKMRETWLPKLATDTVGSFCLSESGSGSDAFALRCAAVPSGDGFTLTGEKLWITNAAEAGVFVVLANAAPERGHRGITAFVVPRDTPGLSVGPKEDKLGIRSSSTCPVTLDGVQVGKEAVLGETGVGYKYAIQTLNEGRIGIAAQMVGLARGCLDATLPYLYERKQFGTVIGDFQGMQHQIAQAETELEAARCLVYNAARLKEAGQDFVTPAAMAKLYSSQVADRVASRCVEWLGGVGFTKEIPVERYYRDVKIGAIYEGTSNIQLNTIAKSISAKYRN